MDKKYLSIMATIIIIVLVSGFLFFSNIGHNNTSNPHTNAINTPDSDKAVDISNEFNETADIELMVERDTTGEEVHNESYTLDSGEEMEEVYNLNESNPDGIEDYTITATYNNQTENVTVTTNQCYGGAVVEITEDGMIYPFYSIC